MSNFPRSIFIQARTFSNDNSWIDFCVRVVNAAEWDTPEQQRVGQRLMNGLGAESPQMFEKIAGSVHDIWELDNQDSEKINFFWARVFELFVEDL